MIVDRCSIALPGTALEGVPSWDRQGHHRYREADLSKSMSIARVLPGDRTFAAFLRRVLPPLWKTAIIM